MQLSSWLTVVIASIVAAIAYLQWRTARNKLALDLFDRRFAVYMDVRTIVSHSGFSHVASFSGPVENFDRGLPNEIIARGRFLFGPDVQALLEQVHSLVIRIDTSDDHASAELDRLFKDRIIPAFDRYLRMETRPLSWRRVV